MAIPKQKLVWMYKSMVRHREFEQKVLVEYAANNIPGPVHLSLGQEAIPAGALSAMRPDDYFTPEHRAHGYFFTRGAKAGPLMAEIFGKSNGIMKGKGGSMHFNSIEFHSLGHDGIVGTQCIVAPGIALSFKLKGTDQVVLCFFGDGVINTERFHTGVNLASVWKLPIVLICVNNLYGASVSTYRSHNLLEIVDRARGYNIPGTIIDGNDVLEVYDTVSKAISRARKGNGPSLIECKTCRWRGHFEGDDQMYRTASEVEECMKIDPIPRFRNKLIEMKVITDRQAEKIHREALAEMDSAVQFAKESSYPSPEELLTDVYA